MAMSKEDLLKAKMEKQNKGGNSPFELGNKPLVDTRNPAPVVTDAVPSHPGLQARERKAKRIQILTYESLVARMDEYAAQRGVSRAEVFEAAVSEFLDKYDQ